jgi:hypothetical protein
MTEDKYVMATRFPIDSYLNQLPTKFNISSTTKTESVYIESNLSGGYEFHKWYPYIRDDMIGSNTSSLFKDSFSISDALIDVMSLDYDGDTATLKATMPGGTNTSRIQMEGLDIKTAVLSIPNLYMHCINEKLHWDDVEGCINLLVSYLEGLK